MLSHTPRGPPLVGGVIPSLRATGWTAIYHTVLFTTYDDVSGSFVDAEYHHVDGVPFQIRVYEF